MMDEPQRYHALMRTSPYGQAFIGKCVFCMKEGLPMSAAEEICDKTGDVTIGESIIMAIEGEQPEKPEAAVRPQPHHPGRWINGNDGWSYPSEEAARRGMPRKTEAG